MLSEHCDRALPVLQVVQRQLIAHHSEFGGGEVEPAAHIAHLVVDEILEGGARGDVQPRRAVVNLQAEGRGAVQRALAHHRAPHVAVEPEASKSAGGWTDHKQQGEAQPNVGEVALPHDDTSSVELERTVTPREGADEARRGEERGEVGEVGLDSEPCQELQPEDWIGARLVLGEVGVREARQAAMPAREPAKAFVDERLHGAAVAKHHVDLDEQLHANPNWSDAIGGGAQSEESVGEQKVEELKWEEVLSACVWRRDEGKIELCKGEDGVEETDVDHEHGDSDALLHAKMSKGGLQTCPDKLIEGDGAMADGIQHHDEEDGMRDGVARRLTAAQVHYNGQETGAKQYKPQPCAKQYRRILHDRVSGEIADYAED